MHQLCWCHSWAEHTQCYMSHAQKPGWTRCCFSTYHVAPSPSCPCCCAVLCCAPPVLTPLGPEQAHQQGDPPMHAACVRDHGHVRPPGASKPAASRLCVGVLPLGAHVCTPGCICESCCLQALCRRTALGATCVLQAVCWRTTPGCMCVIQAAYVSPALPLPGGCPCLAVRSTWYTQAAYSWAGWGIQTLTHPGASPCLVACNLHLGA